MGYGPRRGARAVLIVIVATLVGGTIWGAIRGRPIDVEIKPLPPAPANNSFWEIAELSEQTVLLAEKSFELREGRRVLPLEGDDELRAGFAAAIKGIRDQYVRLIGRPYMPRAHTSLYNPPFNREGVGYWSVAEALVLDDLLRQGKFDRAADQLQNTLLFAHQLASHGDLAAAAMSSFFERGSLRVVDRHFRNIPASEARVFCEALLKAEEHRRPASEMIDGSEATSLLTLTALHEQADFLGAAVLDARAAARELRRYYNDLREAALQPIAARVVEMPTHYFAQLLADDGFELRLYDVARVHARLLIVALSVRSFYHNVGRYPESLSELQLGEHALDPFTGRGLVYKTGDEGFLLYSVGYNGKDDGGVRARNREEGDFTVLPADDGAAVPVWLR